MTETSSLSFSSRTSRNEEIKSIKSRKLAPCIAFTAIVVAAVVGVAFLFLGVYFSGAANQIGFIASLTTGSVCIFLSIGGLTFVFLRSKTQEKSISSPVIPAPANPATCDPEPPVNSFSSETEDPQLTENTLKPLPTYGHMAHAPNFCFAASSIVMLFLGTNLLTSALETARQANFGGKRGAFIEHLASEVVAPLRAGNEVDLKTMEECQRLAWEIWKEKHGSKKVHDRLAVGSFLEFLFDTIGASCTRNPYLKSSSEKYEVASSCDFYFETFFRTPGVSIQNFLRKMFDSVVYRFTRIALDDARCQELKTLQEEGTLHFDRFVLLEVFQPANDTIHGHGEIDEKIPIAPLLPAAYGKRIKKDVENDYLFLRSVLVCDPRIPHAYTFIRLDDHQWLKHDDLENVNEICTFEEMTHQVGKYGIFFLYEKVSVA
jgi:hypothetical protein